MFRSVNSPGESDALSHPGKFRISVGIFNSILRALIAEGLIMLSNFKISARKHCYSYRLHAG